MAKSLTVDQAAALAAPHHVECLLIQVDLPTGVQRYTTAGATLPSTVYDPGTLGLPWIGGVDPSAIEPVRESEASEAIGLKVTLSGVPSSQRALALGQHIQGRAFDMWVAPMDPTTYTVVGTPVPEFSGMLDVLYPEYRETESGIQVVLVCEIESDMARLLSTNETRYTDRDHQRLHPGDTICRFTSQSEKTLVWPSASFFRR